VAKGKKVLHFDLSKDPPSKEELLALLLGRSGTLRAPALRFGGTLVVGYNPSVLDQTLL